MKTSCRIAAFITILCVFLLVLSGCSSTNPFDRMRIHNKKDDAIKFNGFNWLVEKQEIEQRLSNGITDGELKSIPYDGTITEYENNIKTRGEMYYRSDDNVMTEVGGYDLYYIEITYISNDNFETSYMIGGKYTFYADTDNSSEIVAAHDEIYEDLNEKLSNLYTYSDNGEISTTSGDVIGTYNKYIDENDNFVKACTYLDSQKIELRYYCGDINDILKEMMQHKKISSEEYSGL